MQLCDVNPYLRWAELQPWVLSNIPPRCSYDYRIFYILEGSTNFMIEDRRVPIAPGTLLYFRPGVPYSFDGRVKGIVLNFDMTRNQSHCNKPRSPIKSLKFFDPSLIFENDPPPELESFIVIENAFEVESKVQECLIQFGYPNPYSDGISSALVKEILCYIAGSADKSREASPRIVQDVFLFIQQNFDKELSNAQISEHFGYHSFYLNRIFKKHTGKTLHQAVIGEKMQVAKLLLAEDDLSVALIAETVGYVDRSQFCTAFRKYTGYTTTEYKNYIRSKKH